MEFRHPPTRCLALTAALTSAALTFGGLGCTDDSDAPLRTEADAVTEGFSKRLEIPSFDIDSTGDRTTFTGIALTNDPARPALPVIRKSFLLPAHADMETVSVKLTNVESQELDGRHDLEVVAVPTTEDGTPIALPYKVVKGKDIAIYESNALFPASPLHETRTGTLAVYKIVDVTLFPVQYNPVSGKLVRILRGDLDIEYAALSTGDVEPLSPAVLTRYQTMLREQTDNYRQFVASYDGATAQGNGVVKKASALVAPEVSRYTIVTTAQIASGSKKLSAFMASKGALGFDVDLATEYDWGGGTGDTAAENLRSWLQNNYLTRGMHYLLLIGNPHPEEGDVPMKRCDYYPSSSDPDQRTIPTDLYYAELTSDWDSNGDGLYGQVNFDNYYIDQHYELSVGRIPYYGDYEDYTELDTILERIINYENTPQHLATWRENALLPMESTRMSENPAQGETVISEILEPEGWRYHRVYDPPEDYYQPYDPAILQPESVPCSYDTVSDAWSEGAFGIVYWATHGSVTSAQQVMTTSRAGQLHDDYPSIVWLGSCNNSWAERPDNLGYALLKSQAIATIGATRESTTGLHYPFIRGLVKDYLPAGDALNAAKSDRDASWSRRLLFNLYGCPAVGVYTHPDKQYRVARAINAGGEAYTANDGTVYEADTAFVGGNTTAYSHDIIGTLDDPIYQTERYADGSFSYEIDGLENGRYVVKLQFAENYFDSASKADRNFAVSLEGVEILDWFQPDRHNPVHSVHDVYRGAKVTDGTLNIDFYPDRYDNPMVNGIVVYRLEEAPPCDGGCVTVSLGEPMTVSPNTSVHDTTFCPAGSLAVGGGFSVSSDALSVVGSSKLDDGFEGWWADSAFNRTDVPQEISVSANCLAGAPSNATVTKVSGTALTLPPWNDATATATCPSGILVGGGYATYANDPVTLVYRNTISPADPDTWEVSAFNPSKDDQQLVAYAVCLDNTSYTVQPAYATLRADGMATATCPDGLQSVGGGFEFPMYTQYDVTNMLKVGDRKFTVKMTPAPPYGDLQARAVAMCLDAAPEPACTVDTAVDMGSPYSTVTTAAGDGCLKITDALPSWAGSVSLQPQGNGVGYPIPLTWSNCNDTGTQSLTGNWSSSTLRPVSSGCTTLIQLTGSPDASVSLKWWPNG